MYWTIVYDSKIKTKTTLAMKKGIWITLTLLLLVCSIYGQIDQNGNLSSIGLIETDTKSTNGENGCFDNAIEFDNVRALSEINVNNRADSYPWISNDGLRLYYTKQTDSIDIIVRSERAHPDSLFSSPIALSINSPTDRNISCWLTDDELNIYFFVQIPFNDSERTLFHASRNDILEVFDEPAQIDLIGDISGYSAAPSFTEDMEQLFIFNSSNDGQVILIFDKVNADEYLLVDNLSVPEGFEISPGQLGNDDLSYYLSLKEENGTKLLYVAERESIEADFDSIHILCNSEINDSLFQVIQPSISKDGNYFVFVKNVSNFWPGNDLFIAANDDITVANKDLTSESIDINVYPNPTIDQLTFEFKNDFSNTMFTLLVYSSNGRLVETQKIPANSQNFVLPISAYAPGFYYYKIKRQGQSVDFGKFVVNGA